MTFQIIFRLKFKRLFYRFLIIYSVFQYGASVHIACRSKERGENAVKEILEKSNVDSSKVKLHLLDLSKSNDVHLFAKSFAQETKLFCLVNNAGCMLNTRAENSYGYEV